MSSGGQADRQDREADNGRPAKRRRATSPPNEELTTPPGASMSHLSTSPLTPSPEREHSAGEDNDSTDREQSDHHSDLAPPGLDHDDALPRRISNTEGSVVDRVLSEFVVTQPPARSEWRPRCIMHILKPNDPLRAGVIPRWGLEAAIPFYYYEVPATVSGIIGGELTPLGIAPVVWHEHVTPEKIYHTPFYVLPDHHFERDADFIIGKDWLQEAGLELTRVQHHAPVANSPAFYARSLQREARPVG
ncbi:uncharacterized protein AB675_11407 [Cyphellophora attinorum]|uniref:Uncharacterized protein n=1 Tax=Cyphellophora attinorum TaxID=1664694 RepID=A0A0N1HB35_9EURO|nr:uncharacterized protein AB675_11407 [Phialophora attinorum]KPI40217.1 hypothetical protein AB675_11407 [Phialophora attinorum]